MEKKDWREARKRITETVLGQLTESDQERLLIRAVFRLVDEVFNTAEAKAEALDMGVDEAVTKVLHRLHKQGRQKKVLKVRLDGLTEEQRRALEELGLL